MNQTTLPINSPSNLKLSDMINGLEVLRFENTELLKKKGDQTKFSSVGTLHVFYFPHYDRFLLYLNDWAYALLKRLPVVRSVKSSTNSFFYIFPSYNGSYIIKLTKSPYREALQNFETILANNTQFSYQGEGTSLTPEKVHFSDDLKHSFQESKASNPDKENSSLIGNLSGKEKIHRGFKKIASKFHRPSISQVHPNAMLVKDYNSLKNSPLPNSFAQNYERKDVETTIIRCKDIAKSLGYDTTGFRESFASEAPNTKLKSPSSTLKQGEFYKLSYPSSEVGQSDDLKCIEEELAIIHEIERERLFQMEERTLAEKHQILEHYYEIKEREANDLMTGDLADFKVMKSQEREFIQSLRSRDTLIADIEKKIKTNYHESDKAGPINLREQLKSELAHLWYKEQLVDAEHLKLQNKMSELLQNYERKQAELLFIEAKKSELFKIAEQKDAEIKERWKAAEIEIDELQHEDADLNTRARCKFLELMQMEEATELELEEISRQRQELLALVQEREKERLQYEKSLNELHHKTNESIAELAEKEMAINIKLEENEKKRRELELGEEAQLSRLINHSNIKEAEYRDLVNREEGLIEAIRAIYEDIETLVKVRKQIEEEFVHKVTTIQNKTRLKEEEHAELVKIRRELAESAQWNENICRELEQRMNELLTEAKRRERELAQKEEIIAKKNKELEQKKEEIYEKLERKILEINMKEKQLDMERLDLKGKTREIERLHEIYGMEIMDLVNNIEQLRIRETQFFSHNQDLLLSYQSLAKEVRRMEKEMKKNVEIRRFQRQTNVEFGNDEMIGIY